MRLKKTNVLEKLTKTQKQQFSADQLLASVHEILNKSHSSREPLEYHSSPSTINEFNIDYLDASRIYHIDAIKTICINYRLRFLDHRYFKAEIPLEAISELKRLEEEHQTQIQGLKIIAPSKLFKLENKDDPVLFAPLGNNYFYLVYKWGNDLHPLRRWLMWPFKDPVNLGVLALLISYLITLLIPEGLFSKSSGAAEFWILFFFTFKSIVAIVIFYLFALGKNFSPAIWNSKYFNA